MWEHTGASEKNGIKHLDLVLIDEKVFIFQTCNYYNKIIFKKLIFFSSCCKRIPQFMLKSHQMPFPLANLIFKKAR
jgi:hypothetical protein